MRTSLPVMNAPSAPMSSAPTVPTSSGVPPRPTGDRSTTLSFGDLTLDYEALDLPGDAGQRILSAEPASASQQALDLLASWASTPAAADRFAAPSQAKSPPAHQRSNLGRTSAPTGSSSRPPGERT